MGDYPLLENRPPYCVLPILMADVIPSLVRLYDIAAQGRRRKAHSGIDYKNCEMFVSTRIRDYQRKKAH